MPPVSLREYLKGRKSSDGDIVVPLAKELMLRVGQEVPVLPVPLVATALLQAGAPLSRAELEAAVNDLMADLPNAHVHIRTIAALAHELAGNRAAAEQWSSEIRRVTPGYTQDQFFQAFPFRDEHTLAIAQAALKRLAM